MHHFLKPSIKISMIKGNQVPVIFYFNLGETFYGRAFQKAFALLKTKSTDVNNNLRKKVILFLTDGKPTDKMNVTVVLEQEKLSLKQATSKDVVMFAYGIGSHDFSLLRKIAEDTEAEGTKVKINIKCDSPI